jgi:chitosanase
MINQSSKQVQTVPGLQYFPSGTLNQLNSLTGLDAQQITNILGMINGPEQSKSEWWLTEDDGIIYGYAENIDDGRGVTIGLYGATTGQGYSDADVIWENYGHKEYGKLPQKELIEKVHQIANDPKWWKAQWDAYISTYWIPTIKLLQSKGYTRALTIGAAMDTAMNAGMDDDNSQHWGVNHLFKEASADTRNQQDFLNKYLELRLKFPTRDSGDMKKRVGAWQKLLHDQQWEMRIDLNKYVYIPE